MLTETISLLELFTALLLIVGLCVTGRALYLVIGDLARLKRKPDYIRNGVRHVQAKGHIRTEARKFTSILAFVIAVGVMMLYEPRGGNQLHPASIAVLTAIMWTIVLMIVDTLMYLLDRERILDLLDQDRSSSTPEGQITSRVKVIDEDRGILEVPVRVEQEDG